MKRVISSCAMAALVGLALLQPAEAGSRGGAVAAGVLGGLVAGAIIGGAVAGPQYGPPPAYVVDDPYYAPRCYYTRGRPVWDDYRGIWVRPRVRVCE